jgi:hypothetical protein
MAVQFNTTQIIRQAGAEAADVGGGKELTYERVKL